MTNENMSRGPKAGRTVPALEIRLDKEETNGPMIPHCPTNEKAGSYLITVIHMFGAVLFEGAASEIHIT